VFLANREIMAFFSQDLHFRKLGYKLVPDIFQGSITEKTITQDSYGLIILGSVFQYGKINVFSKTPPAA